VLRVAALPASISLRGSLASNEALGIDDDMVCKQPFAFSQICERTMASSDYERGAEEVDYCDVS